MAYFPDAGKIQDDFFNEIIFPKCGKERSEVTVGPAYGVDVSIVQLPGGMAMALSSDPLSLIPSLGLRESAWLSVHILANDMATTGYAPMYAQFVLNLPETISVDSFNEYWNHIHQYCKEMGIAITGGHTGQVAGQNSTMAGGGTFITVAPTSLLLTSKNARPGNVIIVTKECALTATSILAMSFPETVKNKAGVEAYHNGCELFYQTTSLQDGLTAAAMGTEGRDITAMHDVTEGGVLGAIYEMAAASNCGVVINNEDLPIGETQAGICSLFTIDPRFVVGAGSMIIAAEEKHKEKILSRLRENNIKANIVGYLTGNPGKKELIVKGETVPLIHPGTDAYWNAFYNAFHKGWK